MDELLDFLSFLRQFKTKLKKVLISKEEVYILFEYESIVFCIIAMYQLVIMLL